MISLLESSLIYRFLYKIYKFFELTYSTSFLKKISDAVKYCFQYSIINRGIQNFLNSNSNAKRSYTYKFLSFIGRILDFVVGKFGSFVLSQLKLSAFMTFLNRVKEELLVKPGKVAFVFIIPLIIGFTAVTTIHNTWSPAKFEYILLFVLLGAVGLCSFTSWKQWLRNSIIYKLCHNLWE